MNTKYFQLRDFKKTYQNHYKRMVKLQDEYKIGYTDVVDSDFWVTVETQTHDRLMKYQALRIKTNKRQISLWINEFARIAIQGSLKWHEVPESYDTAFYISHYMKINEGMNAILQNFIDRGEVK